MAASRARLTNPRSIFINGKTIYIVPDIDCLILKGQASSLIKENRRRWPEKRYISTNFSESTFNRPDIIERCSKILDRHEIPPKQIAIEVDEQCLRHGSEVEEKIYSLKKLGMRIALDIRLLIFLAVYP